MDGDGKKPLKIVIMSFLSFIKLHCKCFDHKNYGDWKLRGPCKENLHYLLKKAWIIMGFSCDYEVSPQFLQSFSIDSANFFCMDFAVSSPRSFYGQNICSVVVSKLKYEIVKEMATLWVICRHKNSTHFQNAPVLMKARSIYDVSNRP